MATGCGTERPARLGAHAAGAAMSPAVLSAREVPEGYLPAENQHVFAGLRPRDRDCVRLLELADLHGEDDLRGVRGAPQAHAAFYRVDPGASLVHHVFRLPAGRAHAHIAETRSAAASCPRISVEIGDRDLRLDRVRLRSLRGVKDGFSVRYADGDLGVDVVMARARDDLLVLAAPGESEGARETERLLGRALSKLRRLAPGSGEGRAKGSVRGG
ncbi:hypothetical protein [Spirillospora sp. CA-294931]|uniref:hypothetical protein n=1 Tax=Spirillospora sp. CA-294931 TaxID=3240042 RepID=UPI003D8F5CE6